MDKEITFVDNNTPLESYLLEIAEMTIFNRIKKPNNTNKIKAQAKKPCEAAEPAVNKNTEEIEPKAQAKKPCEAAEPTVNKNTEEIEPKAEVEKPCEAAEPVDKKTTEEKKTANNAFKFLHDVTVNAAGGVMAVVIVAVVTKATGVYDNIKSIPSLASKEDIASMLTTDDIADMVTTDDIAGMLTTNDIADMVTKNDIVNMATQTDIAGLRTEIKEIEGNLKSDIAYVKGRLGIVIEPNEYFKDRVSGFYDNAYSESEDYVWIDLKQEAGRELTTGDICTAEDLINETVVLSYVDENNDEVFVKCCFTEDNQWNGKCITNKYSDGNLKSIVNADYEYGKLVAYHQVFSYINASGTEVWAISSRTVKEKGNAGQTWTFFKEQKEWKKNFEKINLKAENIIDEDYFYNIMNLNIEGYYNGYTADGQFNDENEDGTAYMIKYTEDGYTRMLYTGQFAGGQPRDLTGSALVIALGRDGKSYYYYNGKIESISQIEEDWEEISVEEIKRIINASDYECSLIWYGEVV